MLLQHHIASRKLVSFACRRDGDISPVLERRTGAVLAADIVGYTRLMSLDEIGTHIRYKSLRRELIDPKIAEYGARFVKSTGDGVLAEFRSALAAVRCAVQVQENMAARSKPEESDHRIVFRMGLSYGNIIVDPEDIYGDAVNIGSHLQAAAPPGGIAMSANVVALIQGVLSLRLDDLGPQSLKNMDRAVHTYLYRPPDPARIS